MVFAVANSRIAVEAIRPNPRIWEDSKETKPFVTIAKAAIADFAQTETARSLAGDDIAARLVVAEVVFDQVLAAHLAHNQIAGGTAIVEMAEIVTKHATGAAMHIPLATNTQQVEFAIKKLTEEYNAAPGVWELL